MHKDIYNELSLSDFGVTLDETSESKQDETNIVVKNRMEQIKGAIVNFFVKERLPLSKMDSIHFNNLIEGKYLPFYVLCLNDYSISSFAKLSI